MNKLPLIGLLALVAVLVSGCAQDPTVNVDIYVQDESGNPIANAYVNAYSNYSLGSGIADRWTSLNGTLDTSTRTDASGKASVQILPGNYAFQASANGQTAGTEKLIITGSNSVTIVIPNEKTSLTISIVDEQGNYVPTPIKYTGEACSVEGTAECQNVGGELTENPTISNNITNQSVSYNLTLTKEGYEETQTTFTIWKGQNNQVEIVMKKKGTVPQSGNFEIRFKDEEGNSITDPTGTDPRNTYTEEFCPVNEDICYNWLR